MERTIVVCKWQAELVTALLRAGAEVHLVLDRYDQLHDTPDPGVLDRCSSVHRVTGFDSLEELSAIAVDLHDRGIHVDQVLSHNELSQFGAGYLELLLGTVAEPLRHVSHRDKRLMKSRVRAAGVPTTEFRSLPDPGDRQRVADIGSELAMPVVVKPVAGYGAMSTHRANDVPQLGTITADFRYEPLLRSRQLMVEEFVDGTEMCVDSIWSSGRPLVMVGHQYHEPRLGLADSPEDLSIDGSRVVPESEAPEVFAQVRELHERVNGALGISDGPTHMEVFVGEDGRVTFSEIASRVGGGWIPDMLATYLGHSIWDLVAQAAMTGECAEPTFTHPFVGTAHIRPATPGVISSFPDEQFLEACPGVVGWRAFRGVGDRARLSHPSEWYLYLILGAQTRAALDDIRVRVAREVVIETA